MAVNYGMAPAVADRMHYCGYVCATDESSRRGGAWTWCLNGSKAERLIVATAGGGADAYPLMEASCRRCRPSPPRRQPPSGSSPTVHAHETRRALQLQANGSA